MKTEESIAAALLRIVNDEPLRMRLGQRARQRMIAEFSTGQVVKYYENLFNEILSPAKDSVRPVA